MKKLFLLLFIGLSSVAYAQPGPLDVSLGIKGGMNFTRMQGSTWTGGYRSGIVGGAFASVGLKKIAGQAEVLVATTTFSGLGSSFNEEGLLINPADSTQNGSFSATHIQIPLLLKLRIFGNASLLLGPQYSTLISVKDKDIILNQPPEDIFNSGDLAGVVGVQLNLPLKLNAGVRYTFGFTDQNLTNIDDTWKLSTIQVHLGFSFL